MRRKITKTANLRCISVIMAGSLALGQNGITANAETIADVSVDGIIGEALEELDAALEDDGEMEAVLETVNEAVSSTGSDSSEVVIVNNDFSNDIWGEDAGWTVWVDDWDVTGASIKSFQYSSDSWMEKPSDGSDNGLNYWFGSGDGVLKLTQNVSIPAGTYEISAEVMGEKSDFVVSVIDNSSETVELTGYNNWLVAGNEFSVDSDIDDAVITLSLNVSKDGWGYINSVKIQPKNTESGDGNSGDEENDGNKDDAGNSGSDENGGNTGGSGNDGNEGETDGENGEEPVESEIFVEKVDGVDNNFITGVDVSSYLAEKNSGVKYYDFEGNELSNQGFFEFLRDCGVNYVRLRVWNDPKNSEGNYYGGGNCDLNAAVTMGKWASEAGMKVLIDFHYSDFWADPGKQTAPKSWAALSVDEKAEAVDDFTYSSLNTLIGAGVNVGMVQVGNETNNGVAGETAWENMAKIFSAGSTAVRRISEETGKTILVAVHFTNPETSGRYAGYAQKLDQYNVDYDVFASSYYPYWHGTIDNLHNVLSDISDTYGKKVMVAETSYVHTLKDGDGHGNTEYEGKTGDAMPYDVSVQGQANSVRNVINAVATIDRGIGVFYWEPAWIPVNVYYENSEDAAEVLSNNKNIWETCGSGWAASYAGDYDKDAGEWYGGSAVDNEAWFGFDGKALASAKIYNYVRSGAVAERRVLSVTVEDAEFEIGDEIGLPEKAVVEYNDLTKVDTVVTWNEDEVKEAMAKGAGEYSISGTAVVDEESLNVTCKLTIKAKNLLADPGFEAGPQGGVWVIDDSGNTDGKNGVAIQMDSSNIRTGDYSLKFWDNEAIDFTVEQKIILNKGIYTLGGYIEGGDCGDTAELELYAVVNGEKLLAKTGVTGWQNWDNPEVKDITITENSTEVIVGVSVKGASGGWGAWDDLYLNRTGDVEAMSGENDGTGDDEKPSDGENSSENGASSETEEDSQKSDDDTGKDKQGQNSDKTSNNAVSGQGSGATATSGEDQSGAEASNGQGTSSVSATGSSQQSNTSDNATVSISDEKTPTVSTAEEQQVTSSKKVKVKKVKLNKKSKTLRVGKSFTLKATVKPSNATNKKVTWKSSNTKVARVSRSGKVTAVKKGTATITVTTKDGKYKATCKIKVK